MSVYITFYANPKNIDILDVEENKSMLKHICNKLISYNVGFDVKSISFSLELTKDFEIEDA